MRHSKIAKREKMAQDERCEFANDLVIEWLQSGKIQNLFRDFKKMVDEARSFEGSGRFRRRE